MVWLWGVLIAGIAAVCDFKLAAQPGKTNLWAVLAQISSPAPSFTLCLTGSSGTGSFVLDDTPFGCVWPTSLLLIQYFPLRSLCEGTDCTRQTIWLQGRNPCYVRNRLVFINVVLSGRHHFTEACEEGQDWCTHCLNPELLVQEDDGSYHTVIEHHTVTMDASYYAWQAKCMWTVVNQSVFVLGPGTLIVFQDSDVVDVRYGMSSFLDISGATVRLINVRILRADSHNTFILATTAVNSVQITSSYIAELNRDHAYTPEIKEGSFLRTYFPTVLAISSTVFTDNLFHSSNYLLYGAFLSFNIAHTEFRRGSGQVMLSQVTGGPVGVITNVTFDGVFAPSVLLYIAGSIGANLTASRFTNNQVQIMLIYTQLISLNSVVFRNNRILGTESPFIILLTKINGKMSTVENCVLEENGAFDSSFETYWADYYLSKGLLNDNGLTTKKGILLDGSFCSTMLYAPFFLSILNTSLTDTTVTPCDFAISIEIWEAYEANLLVLRSLRISSSAMVGLYAYFKSALVSRVIFEDSVIERASVLWQLDADSPTYVNSTNVTFQYSKSVIVDRATVFLRRVTARLWNCNWRHNRGSTAGALSLVSSNLVLQDSHFFNNSCDIGPGDLLFSNPIRTYVSFQVLNCTFTASQSTQVASILLSDMVFDPSFIFNCTFTQSQSDAGTVLQMAQVYGTFVLRSLLFIDITAPSSYLILISTPTDTVAAPVATRIEELQVRRSRFYRGIVVQPWSGQPTVVSVNNHFEGNNGTAIWVNAGKYTDTGSAFIDNIGSFGLFYQSQNTSASLYSSVFRGNRFVGSTGMLQIEGPAVMTTFQDCEFSSNQCPTGIQAVRHANVSILNSKFTSNRFPKAIITVEQSSLLIQHCSFLKSSDQLVLKNAQVIISFTVFAETISSEGIFVLVQSELVLQDSIIANLRQLMDAKVCVLLAQFNSTAVLTNVEVKDVTCSQEVFALTNSALAIHNTTLMKVSGGTSVIALSLSRIQLSLSSVTACNATDALIRLIKGEARLSNVLFADSVSQVFSASSSNLTLEGCRFSEISVQSRTGILECADCGSIFVTDCIFKQISANLVAGIDATVTNFTASRTSFQSLRAEQSGALRIAASYFVLSNSIFFNNSATGSHSSGGALHLSGSNSFISQTIFRENTAWTGGAIRWLSGKLEEQNNEFEGNSAVYYGSNIASFASRLWTPSNYLGLASGRNFEGAFIVYLKDHWNQTVLTDSTTQAWLNSSDGISGKSGAVASTGQLSFSGFSVTASPGSNISISIETDTSQLNFTFILAPCERGEIELIKTCSRCHSGTYSLVLKANDCKICPEGAKCPGGDKLYLKPHYWRPHEAYEGVFLCPRPESCLGQQDNSSTAGDCAPHYTGNLCQSCKKDAFRRGKNLCVSCPNNSVLQLQAILMIFWYLGMILLQAWASTRANARLGVLLRIFVDYLQITVLVTDFDLNWPDPLQYFFLFHLYLGNAVQIFLPVDCLYTDSFVITTIAAAILPLVITAFFLLFWTFISMVFKAIRRPIFLLKSLCVSSIVAGLAYVYPFIVRVFLSAFICTTIEPGEQWLRTDMAIRCWDKRHLVFALAASLPSMVIWGAGLPVLAIFFLIKFRQNDGPFMFLHRGFKENRHIWEVETALFKALIAVFYVVFAVSKQFTQALLLLCLLSFAFLLQWKAQPFEDNVYGRVALKGLIASWATNYGGLYFSASARNEVLQGFIFLLHALFLLTWGFAASGLNLQSLWKLCRSQLLRF